MHGHQLCFEDVKTGTALTPLVKRPTTDPAFPLQRGDLECASDSLR